MTIFAGHINWVNHPLINMSDQKVKVYSVMVSLKVAILTPNMLCALVLFLSLIEALAEMYED